jgi:hypothetical protein
VGGPVAAAVSAGIHERKDALRAVPGKAANAEIGKENITDGPGDYVTHLTVQFIQRL